MIVSNFGPKIRVESGQVSPQGQTMGPIRSGWPQIGFKFGFNSITYLINPNESDLTPRVQIRAESCRVRRVHLAVSRPYLHQFFNLNTGE